MNSLFRRTITDGFFSEVEKTCLTVFCFFAIVIVIVSEGALGSGKSRGTRLFFCIYAGTGECMAESELDGKILEDCEAVVRGMGCEIVELKSLRAKKGVQVFIVIHAPSGVSIDLCSTVLTTLRPRIQMLTDDPDVSIEVSSPGIERTIKSVREYGIFRGRGLRLLSEDSQEWTAGIITEVTGMGVTLKSGDMSRTFSFSDIRKAKLDHTQEGV